MQSVTHNDTGTKLAKETCNTKYDSTSKISIGIKKYKSGSKLQSKIKLFSILTAKEWCNNNMKTDPRPTKLAQRKNHQDQFSGRAVTA